MFQKLWDKINMDVGDPNETKKVAVIIRVFSLISALNFLGQSIVHGILIKPYMAFFGVMFMFFFLGAFQASYMNHTRQVVVYVILLSLLWTALYIVLMGWDSGFQQQLIVVMIFMLATNDGKIWRQLGGVVVMTMIRIVLFELSNHLAPREIISTEFAIFNQTINAVSTYLMVAIIVILFSKDALAMERKLRDYNTRISLMASTDPLTLLPNRRSALEHMERRRTEYEIDSNATVAIGDIDFFKMVNDTFGHEAGDEVLKSISNLFADYMKDKGIAARWGGEEFLLFFDKMNGDQAFIDMEHLRVLVKNNIVEYEGNQITVTMTFGMEELDVGKPLDYMIARADKKLYMGKKNGRNRVVF